MQLRLSSTRAAPTRCSRLGTHGPRSRGSNPGGHARGPPNDRRPSRQCDDGDPGQGVGGCSPWPSPTNSLRRTHRRWSVWTEIAKAAELLNAAGRDTSTAILSVDRGRRRRPGAWTFDKRCSRSTISAASTRSRCANSLRELPSQRLRRAQRRLSGVHRAVFAGLSSRAAELIRDDLEVQGRVKKSEVEAARREIVEAALRLESEGRIDLGREGE